MKIFCNSAFTEGEKCRMCIAPASHKVGEEQFSDDPWPMRHNFTSYLCCRCFAIVMGPAAKHVRAVAVREPP
jgi:hypothetical protein